MKMKAIIDRHLKISDRRQPLLTTDHWSLATGVVL